ARSSARAIPSPLSDVWDRAIGEWNIRLMFACDEQCFCNGFQGFNDLTLCSLGIIVSQLEEVLRIVVRCSADIRDHAMLQVRDMRADEEISCLREGHGA